MKTFYYAQTFEVDHVFKTGLKDSPFRAKGYIFTRCGKVIETQGKTLQKAILEDYVTIASHSNKLCIFDMFMKEEREQALRLLDDPFWDDFQSRYLGIEFGNELLEDGDLLGLWFENEEVGDCWVSSQDPEGYGLGNIIYEVR